MATTYIVLDSNNDCFAEGIFDSLDEATQWYKNTNYPFKTWLFKEMIFGEDYV